MRIGIDIDNTLTDVQKELSIALYEYAKSLGKEVGDSPAYIEDVKDDGRIYQEKYNLSYEELMYFMNVIQEKIMNNATPRFGVHEVINTLKSQNDKIYIITARDSEFHSDPYLLSKNWLESNNIKYDKLIVNARNKVPICVKEKIDVFIDDKLSNCINISRVGVKAVRIGNTRGTHEGVETFTRWLDIYDYISKLKNGEI